jgi:hypothetical protein
LNALSSTDIIPLWDIIALRGGSVGADRASYTYKKIFGGGQETTAKQSEIIAT